MKYIKLAFVISLQIVVAVINGYEYRADSPMPTKIMSRFANMSKPKLVIPHITEFDGFFGLVIPLGIQMAIERLANATPHLSKFELQVELRDSYCDDAAFIKESIAMMEGGWKRNLLPIHMAGGCPANGQRFVGESAHHFNFTAIAGLDVVTESFQDRNRYQNFFTLGESIRTITDALLSFMSSQGWKRIALIGEDHSEHIAVSLL